MADKRISQLVERTDIANNDVLPIVASGATTTNKVTVSTLQEWMQDNLDVGVTSVGLSMPSAFVVSASPVTTSGNIAVTGAGTVSQYIRGDGSLADFPQSSGGGGASVSYYLNGSVSQGTIGGVAYLEMSKTPILGAGTDFTINANGYIASFITDAGDPNLLLIPGGNWNFETYFAASSGGGTPSFYVELYKVSGSTATLVASNSANPEVIAFGTSTTAYFSSLAVPTTTLALTDRLALRYYVTHAGRTITLHTENSNLCQIITTFTTGLTALNGLTAQVQNFATGTSGTDFAISSSTATHTFNLPDASASARGVVTTGSQVFGGVKTFSNGVSLVSAGGTNQVTRIVNIGTIHEGSAGSNQLGFNNSNNIYFGKGLNNGGVITWNNAAVRYYALPDADGTIALTSNLGAYLPLAGGTLTGALGGTSATFSGDVQSNTRLAATSGTHSIIITPNVGSTNRIEAIGSLPLALVSAHPSITMAAGGTTPQFTLGSSGLVTLTGALNGTSASFTGTVLTPFISVSGSAGNIGNINSTNANGGYITWQTSGTTIADLGSAQQIFGAGGSDTFGINARGARSLILGTNDTARLTISSTGAATFSSSVQGNRFFSVGSLNSTDGSFYIDHPSVQTWKIGITNSNTSTFSIGNDNGGAFANKVLNIGNDNAMGFNYPILGSRSFMFRSISGRPLGIEIAENGGVHSLYLRPNASGRHLISSNYLSGGVYLPLALSGRENDTDFVLSNTGNVGIGTASPSNILSIRQSNTSTATVLELTNTSTGSNTTKASRLLFGLTDTAGSVKDAAYIESTPSSGLPNVQNAELIFGNRTGDAAPAERMRITSSGNVGIGTPSPDTFSYGGNRNFLTFRATATNQEPFLQIIANGVGNSLIDFGNESIRRATIIGENGSNLAFYTNGSNSGTGVTERMRITSGGNVLIGSQNSDPIASRANGFAYDNSFGIRLRSQASQLNLQIGATSGTNIQFWTDNGANVAAGSISSSGSVTSYNVTSDYRLKEDLQEIKGLEKVQSIKVYDYKWKGSETRMDGVLAHELAEVLPYAVYGEKDEVNEDGTDKMQGVDYSKIVPILIKAIQEQQEQIKSLTEQVEALKSQING